VSSNDPADRGESGADAPAVAAGAVPRPWLATGTMLAAIAGGLVAWLVAETRPMHVEPRKVAMVTMGARHEGATAETSNTATIATAVRQYGAFGACLGLALGAAGGLGGHSLKRGLSAAILGAVLGAAAGAGVSFGGVPLFIRFRDSFPLSLDLVPSFLLHGAVWGAIGVASALAWGFGVGDGKAHLVRAALGGVLGVLVGTAAFEMLGAAFFATDETAEPVSTSAVSRLAARMLVSTFTGLGILAAHGARRSGPVVKGMTSPNSQ
jgi:hypothetical protein